MGLLKPFQILYADKMSDLYILFEIIVVGMANRFGSACRYAYFKRRKIVLMTPCFGSIKFLKCLLGDTGAK